MRLKVDENLRGRWIRRLGAAGHDAASVAEEGLSGATDRRLDQACVSEGRCLVTLDLDFANTLVFDPTTRHGIAVLRPPAKTTAEQLDAVVETLVAALEREDIAGKLWIVEIGRVRQHLDPA
jgi:predicted nuclease of predicted toxin-antitoxin system